jgi:Protein of unknown function (DUF1615)
MRQVNTIWWAALLWLAGCAGQQPAVTPPPNPAEARALIEQSLPRSVADRNGWSNDIYKAFSVLTVTPDRENICAVVAVIEQESGFRVDPVIPGLGAIARREIASRAERAHVPMLVVNGVLELKSPDGRSYGARIDAAKTEKDLSDVYEDFIAAVPMGKTLFAERNPIRTRGPMQVNVAFAEQFSSVTPYPYPVKSSIADELFTRRGSVYFGIAHLLDYRAPYDDYLYRFADFNAGQYASRNAAFQRAVGIVAGVPVATDGALLAHDADPNSPGVRQTQDERRIDSCRARARQNQELRSLGAVSACVRACRSQGWAPAAARAGAEHQTGGSENQTEFEHQLVRPPRR